MEVYRIQLSPSGMREDRYPPNSWVASVYRALRVMLTFMSMQQAPMKKPTLWATIVLISRKMSIRKKSFKLGNT